MVDRYEYLAHLIANYLRQELTAKEQGALDAWLAERAENRKFLEELGDAQHLQQKLQAFHGADRERIWALTQRKLAAENLTPTFNEGGVLSFKTRLLRRWLPYAAAILIAAFAATWIFVGDQAESGSEIVNLPSADIQPGGNRATLTLDDGQNIVLDSMQSGIVIGDEEITYQDGTSLAASLANRDKAVATSIQMLTLSTPRGGQYRITLPDGTEVWLNAASTLKYPTKFDREERIVELEGEGYFEVARDTKRPFKVRSAAQEVEVLGTQFNVSAYPDDAGAQTTLVSGAVQIVNSQSKIVKLLRPGEQSVINGASTATKTVNTDLYTAWKDGFFYFDRLPTRVALSQLARWYDLELIYDGKLAKVNMFAYIERNKPLNAVLKALEKSGLKFRVTQSGEQKQLIVLGEQR